MLSAEEIDHYHTFGFVVVRQCFSAREVELLQAECERELTRQYRHRVFDGSQRHFCCMNDDEACPTYARLLGDPRFFDVAEQLVGPALPVWNDANRYVDAVTGWHADTVDEPWCRRMPAVKFCHYLQPLRAHSGALRLIPGSHLAAAQERLRAFLTTYQPDTAAVPAQVCETDPGDVVIFSTPTWHAAVGGRPDRRLSTVAYYPCPTTPEDQRDLLASLRDQVPNARAGFQWRGDVFSSAWLSRAASDPARRRVVERMHAYGVIAAMGADVAAAEQALGSMASR